MKTNQNWKLDENLSYLDYCRNIRDTRWILFLKVVPLCYPGTLLDYLAT